MNNSRRWFSIAVGIGLVALLLVGILTMTPVYAQGPGGMMGGFGSGWMHSNPQYSTETMPFGFGPGWMRDNFQNNGGAQYGPGWMMGGNMMVNNNSPFFVTEPLTLVETTETLNTYLATLNDSNLAVDDIMIFDNHAYAQIVEKDSGIGVMEVLVDPVTKGVYPEMGPNMMWNLKYGMMSGFGRYGMMGGRFGFTNPVTPDLSAEMPISPTEAVATAQTYLDTYFGQANLTADDHADPFYGYYTLHVNQAGKTVGMLSVNGFTGQVFPHTWHGTLLEMSGE